MKLMVFWTPEAEDSFTQNIVYLENEWTETVVENFIQKTEEAINIIRTNPLIYPIANKKRRIRKCLIVKQISVYYRITENRIELITFWNNYQDPRKLKF